MRSSRLGDRVAFSTPKFTGSGEYVGVTDDYQMIVLLDKPVEIPGWELRKAVTINERFVTEINGEPT